MAIGISAVELLLMATVACLLLMLFSKGGRAVGAIVLGGIGLFFLCGMLVVGLFAVTRVTSIRAPMPPTPPVREAYRWPDKPIRVESRMAMAPAPDDGERICYDLQPVQRTV